MASLRGRKNSAIGLFVDGLELKLAKLSIKKGTIVIDELQSTTLSTKLEERQNMNVELDNLSDTSETFALGGSDMPAEGPVSNSNVFISLISKYSTNDYVLGYAVSEPSIYYHTLESNFGLEGKKLKQRVLDELRTVRAVQPAPDAIDFFYSGEKNLICVVREDGVAMLNILEDIKPFIGNRLPRIALIEIGDVALMNLARANYGFAPEEITTIIYIGVEFTRLIFMKGTDFFHFAPVLGEGFDSPNIQNTVYSRLLLEQDNMGIPRIDKILLAGESRRIAFDEFMREQLPEVDIQYLRTPHLDASKLQPEIQEQIPEYAVPIATAWKILDNDHPAFYTTNLLPENVRERQRAFKLAWHGYLLMALVFFASFFFTSRYASIQRDISSKQRVLLQLQDKLNENEKLKAAIAGLEDQITRYNTALAVYDSLVPGADRWNKTVARLAKGVEDLGGIWITEVRSQPGGAMGIQGYALYRGRIPRISALFDNATLVKVEVREIRPNTPPVYNFVISVPPQIEKPAVSDSAKAK
jgi:Tfp pilus assembly protein PilN